MTGVLKDWSPIAANNTTSATGIAVDNGTLFGADHGAGRSIMAAVKALANQLTGAKTTGGSANAQTFTSDTAGAIATAYAAGMAFLFRAGYSNTAACTLNVDGVGAKAIKKGGALSDLVANDIVAGGLYLAVYQATGDCFVLLNPEKGQVAVGFLTPPGHRLSLTTAVAVTTNDVTAAATIYCTPDKHTGIPLYDGASWSVIAQAELSMALDGDSGHTGYHQAGKGFDVFYFDDNGTKRIGTGPAWTNDTTRASDVTRLNGVYVNTSSMTVRFGSASGNTVTLAANRGTYLGSFYATGNGQTGDSVTGRYLFNTYNRRKRPWISIEVTDSWAYTTASYRIMNANNGNRIFCFRGLNEDDVEATAVMQATNSSGTARQVLAAIGLDATNAVASSGAGYAASAIACVTSAGYSSLMPTFRGCPGLGLHYLAPLEQGQGGTGGDSQTWAGDAGVAAVQSGIFGSLTA